jgi:ATP-dependent DNA ligase
MLCKTARSILTVEKLELEGIVGKNADSRYVGGHTTEWLKIKTRAGTEVMKKRVESWCQD